MKAVETVEEEREDVETPETDDAPQKDEETEAA